MNMRSFAMHALWKWLALLQLLPTITVAIDLTCDTANPLVPTNVVCTCKRTSAHDIDWFLNDQFHSNCVLNSICVPQYSGYKYLVNSTVNTFQITINSYNYSSCTRVSCKDAMDGNIQRSVVPSAILFDPTFPILLTEPTSNYINGRISVTTGCISGYRDVKFVWFTISNGSVEEYTDQKSVIDTIDTTSCIKCSSDINGKRTIGFEHTEASGDEYKTVTFRVILFHSPSSSNITLESKNKYRIKVKSENNNDNSDSAWSVGVIVAVVLGAVVVIVLISLLCLAGLSFYRKNREKPTDLTYDESCVTNNSFKVKWKPGPDRTDLKFYIVWYLGNNEVGNETITYDETIEMEYLIENLYPLTIYTVKIQSQIGERKSAFTNPLTVKTTEKPDKPDMFSFDRDSVTSKSVWLTWKPGTYRGPRHTFTFRLYITKEIEIKKIENIEHDKFDVMRYNLKGLNEATNYTVKISAEYNTMISECETIVNFTTKYEMKTVTEKHQSIAGEDEICCESCKKTGGSNESHAYCLSHALYLCLDCLYKKHKNEKCVLLWNTGKIDRKDHKLCCNKNYNHDDLQLKGVCQNRNLFICSQCIEKNHEHANCTNHQQLRGQLDTKARVCCEQNETNGGTETVGFCKKCKTFICASCSKSHAKHSLISPLTDSPMNDVICKGCASKKKLPIECLALHQGLFLCASCYETGNVNKALKIKNEFRESVVKHLQENQDSCGVHEVLGKVKNSPVEVYCLICKLYMCLGCFKKHRRLYEYWSKTLEGNLFYCNRCPSGEYNPVECCDLTSLEFRCRKCYILNVQSSTRMTYTREVTGKMLHLRDMDSQCQVHEDKTMSPTAAVYCLVCKTTMCKSCFKKHIN